MITSIAYVLYPTADVPRATAFYRDIIGLIPGEKFGDYWVEFNVGQAVFAVGRDEASDVKPGSQFSVAFEVDDIVGERNRLIAEGVTVSEMMDSPVCEYCFVTDPDGNRFDLHQRKA